MQMLVTGGAGFIGSHVTRALVENGHTVTVFDNFSTGKAENLARLPVTVLEGDIRDESSLLRAMHGCQVVVHQAGLVSVPRSIADPVFNHTNNVTGTFNVFEAARSSGLRRVVYASSAAVYGSEPSLPKHEHSPIALLSPYAAAKYMAEVYAMAYGMTYPQMEFVGLRYMNVYGPLQDASSPYSGVLSIFCRAGLAGLPCAVYGTGEQTRDFVFVTDVAQATMLAATTNMPTGSSLFNVGSGQQTSLNEVITLLSELLPQPLNVEYGPSRPGDIEHSYADITRIRAQLGYRPQVELDVGLEATLRALQFQR